MATPYTTDEKGFVPLVAVMKAAKTIERLPNNEETYDADAVFVMSPKTALAVQQLCLKQRGVPITSIDDLHLPYKAVIVEMPITPEIEALRNPIPITSEALPIRRIGARMTQSTVHGVNCLTFWPFWEFSNGDLGVGAVCLMLANGSNLPQPFQLMPETVDLHQAIIPAPFLVSAAMSLKLPLEEQFRWVSAILSNPACVDESVEEISPLMFAWESIINCKSGITRTKIPAKAPQGSLGRRKKIMAATEYTVVSLTAVESVNNGQSTLRSDVEAHLVRGHFKRRQSGVYWWSPFIRGTGELKHRKAYIVEGA